MIVNVLQQCLMKVLQQRIAGYRCRGTPKCCRDGRSDTPRKPCKMPSSPAFFPALGKDRGTHDGNVKALQQEWKNIRPNPQVLCNT